LGITL